MIQKVPSAYLEDENTLQDRGSKFEDEDFQPAHVIHPGERFSQDDLKMMDEEGCIEDFVQKRDKKEGGLMMEDRIQKMVGQEGRKEGTMARSSQNKE